MTSAWAHPQGLAVLFFTEMWERFSYYGMRALLVLYLVNAQGYARQDALELYATYTGLVYLAPIMGGYLADRYLGTRQAVAIGAVLMMLGHFAMAFPALLYLALGLLVVGNGFFKPNVSTMVGSLYRANDARRDSGFTIFYMGINLGAFLAPLVCGSLGEKLGWHYGFAAAGVGMLIGLVIFSLGRNRLNGANRSQAVLPIQWGSVLAISVACCALLYAGTQTWAPLLAWWGETQWLERAFVLMVLATVLYTTHRYSFLGKVHAAKQAPLTREEKQRLLTIVIMATFVVFFWMGFEQAGGTMNLFADKQTDRRIFGWEMPASFFQALNPALVILFAPLFSLLWTRLDASRHAPSTVTKQALGMIILGLGFVVLAVGSEHAREVGLVSPLWLAGVYLLNTIGELCLSPIGLSMVTKLAPASVASLMMGVWFAAMALANYLAGTLEGILQHWGFPLYWFLVACSIGAGLILLLLGPTIRRFMHGVS